ncbi:MAG: S-layer homology domain-containing protein [Actinobacteria bacterium]|nr:S-layer homology domain-containing protein [Actinomycetota bacterium]
MRRYFVLILAMVVVLAFQTVVVAADFTDTSGHWARDVIGVLNAMDVVSGDGDGRVRPDDPITRAEFVALLLRAEDIDTTASGASNGALFEDVTPEHWAYPYVQAARARGIINGLDQSHFGPRMNITREQIVAMIVRAARAVEPVKSESKSFTDVEAERWSAGYIQAAYRAGIVNGMGPDVFKPGDPATRAQAMAMIRRLLLAETKPEFLPTDEDLTKLVEDYEVTSAEVISAGYPFNWSRINFFLIGAYREKYGPLESWYDKLGAEGVKWSFDRPILKSKVATKTEHLATVEAEETFNLTVTGPNVINKTTVSGETNLYHLRRMGGAWKIYDVETVKKQSYRVEPAGR